MITMGITPSYVPHISENETANEDKLLSQEESTLAHRKTTQVEPKSVWYSSNIPPTNPDQSGTNEESYPLTKKKERPERTHKPRTITGNAINTTDDRSRRRSPQSPVERAPSKTYKRNSSIATGEVATSDITRDDEVTWHTATQKSSNNNTSETNNTSLRQDQELLSGGPTTDHYRHSYLEYFQEPPSNQHTAPSTTSRTHQASKPTMKDATPMELENSYWHRMEDSIQTGINQLDSANLKPKSLAAGCINWDTDTVNEDHESGLQAWSPIDVDTIDSDLNAEGRALRIGPPSSHYESCKNYHTPNESPSGKPRLISIQHDTSSSLEDVYRQQLPVMRLSPDAYGYQSNIVLDQEDDTPELLISLYPHGILQALLILFPATAIKIIRSRIKILRETSLQDFIKLSTSSVRDREKFREGLTTKLTELDASLSAVENDPQNGRHQLILLQRMRSFEHNYNVYSLQSKMDASFLVQKGRISSQLLATPPEKIESNQFQDSQLLRPSTWPRSLGWRCKRLEYILCGAKYRLAKTKLEESREKTVSMLIRLPVIKVPSLNSTAPYKNILNRYIQEQPEVVKRILAYIVCFKVKYHRSFKSVQAARIVLKGDQQEQTSESLRTLLQQLFEQNLIPEIEAQLEEEVARLHVVRLVHEIESSKVGASLPALLDRQQHILDIETLHPKRAELASAPRLKKVLIQEKNQVSAQLIHLFLSCQTGNHGKDQFPHWYFLKIPPYEHVLSVLSQHENTPEKAFYLSTLKAINALKNSIHDDSYEGDLHWMQCYYDTAYYEQQLLIYLIDQDKPHPLLPNGSFQQNINVLWQLAGVRKTIGHRALNPDSYAYYLSYFNLIWQEEESIEDSIAELYRKQYLKRLNYDPCEEFERLFYKGIQWGTSAWRSLYSNAENLIKKLRNSGLSNPLDILYQGGKGLISALFSSKNSIYPIVVDTLSRMLKVAQQNPRFFRIMAGDLAILIPQLESLLGLQDPSVTDLLRRINICMHGQTLATMFTGDKPHPMDFDPTENPELANLIKQFQFLKDFSAACSKGIQLIQIVEVFLCRSLSQFKNKLKNVAWNSVSTYVAKQCVNNMKPPFIRLFNSMRHAMDLMPSTTLGLTPEFLFSMRPEKAARLAHHIGRHSSILRGIAGAILDPLIYRFDEYLEKVNEVKRNPFSVEARSKLQSERKKFLGIVGVSSLFSTLSVLLINIFKIIVFVSNPFLTGALIWGFAFVCSSCFIARRYNKFDEICTSVSETIAEQIKRTFAKDSPKAIEARKKIYDISKANLEKMSELTNQGLSGWQICKENMRRIALSKHWDQLPYKNKEQILQTMRLKIKEKQLEINEEAEHTHNLLKARALLQHAMKNPDSITTDRKGLSDLNHQLALLHFEPINASSSFKDLKFQEARINSFLKFCYGTMHLGESLEEVINAIESYNINLYIGSHIENLGKMQNIKSSFLNAAIPSEQHTQEKPDEQVKYDSATPFPDAAAIQRIMDMADQDFEKEWLESNAQMQKWMMETVASRALHQSLKDTQEYSKHAIADVMTTPLFKANLAIQINDLNKTSLPLAVDKTEPSTQDPIQPPPGFGYKAIDACKALAAR